MPIIFWEAASGTGVAAGEPRPWLAPAISALRVASDAGPVAGVSSAHAATFVEERAAPTVAAGTQTSGYLPDWGRTRPVQGCRVLARAVAAAAIEALERGAEVLPFGPAAFYVMGTGNLAAEFRAGAGVLTLVVSPEEILVHSAPRSGRPESVTVARGEGPAALRSALRARVAAVTP